MRNHQISRKNVFKTLQMIFVSPFVFLGDNIFQSRRGITTGLSEQIVRTSLTDSTPGWNVIGHGFRPMQTYLQRQIQKYQPSR